MTNKMSYIEKRLEREREGGRERERERKKVLRREGRVGDIRTRKKGKEEREKEGGYCLCTSDHKEVTLYHILLISYKYSYR